MFWVFFLQCILNLFKKCTKVTLKLSFKREKQAKGCLISVVICLSYLCSLLTTWDTLVPSPFPIQFQHPIFTPCLILQCKNSHFHIARHSWTLFNSLLVLLSSYESSVFHCFLWMEFLCIIVIHIHWQVIHFWHAITTISFCPSLKISAGIKYKITANTMDRLQKDQ